ncbi:MAG: hypothetical protein JRE43_12170 [Deltaproteobacteria bacterium]|jgi:hypothetical protein|nr:hypothetical protein [Deltaproteobacteria bacterium]MBW2541974.1 hypothetical protein [Deltaproteobacteria bacterium]
MRSRFSAFDPILACAAFALCAACASTPEVDPVYRPTENVLEVIAVLRAHIEDDTYRFEPARDFTGRNVYRSSLLRLENLEELHADALRAGHMDGVMAFAKARSLERLRAYDLAAESYRLAADISEDLRLPALESADICDVLYEAAEMTRELEPQDEADFDSEATGAGQLVELDPDSVLAEFEARTALLDGLAAIAEGTHYGPIVREEIERADVARANYFVGIRKTDVNGDVRAIGELQRVTFNHPDSKNFNRHLIELADLYAELAVEYSTQYPPESLYFDPVRFQELVEGASRLYEMVASRDGTPEKIEASRRLEAFLAYSIRIDRDRFTP